MLFHSAHRTKAVLIFRRFRKEYILQKIHFLLAFKRALHIINVNVRKDKRSFPSDRKHAFDSYHEGVFMSILWNDEWSFAQLKPGCDYVTFLMTKKDDIHVPHDWLISHTEDLYATGDGWYLHPLYIEDEKDAQLTRILSFDGIYMDADILVNGQVVFTHHYGYTAFRVNISNYLHTGHNQVAVHVRYLSPNSRWYSGAGILRDVYLEVYEGTYLLPDTLQVTTTGEGDDWHVALKAEKSDVSEEPVEIILLDPAGAELTKGTAAVADTHVHWEYEVRNAKTWSLEYPLKYRICLNCGNNSQEISFGFRKIDFSPEDGFFLNGKHIKMHGVCLHHDLGILGGAFNEAAARRQLGIMKEMGVNAIRTSHNPPASAFLDLCDQMGLLVVDEAFDMWEIPKTRYDNARFFAENWEQNVYEWITRDRNHPCVILWSIGNEIPELSENGRGTPWVKRLMDAVRLLDDHAPVTFGSNYMPWQESQNCADIVKIPGYNYAEKYYEDHHSEHPDWVLYGSETGSHLQSRGIYHFPMSAHILSEEDLQCSSLMNSLTSWGTQNVYAMGVEEEARTYTLGQFLWSGSDYIGEPTPYHTRSCYFGQVDTAGFAKDSYYWYQSIWTESPMIHIGVSWDHNDGQMIDVPVMTNAAVVELFLNGRSFGMQDVDRKDPEHATAYWRIPFEPGILAAYGFDETGNVLCTDMRVTSGEPAAIKVKADRKLLQGGKQDIAFLTIEVADEKGNPVENACNRVHVKVEGEGVLLGMDNGDPTDPDPYVTSSKRLFSGKALAMIGAGKKAGRITVTVSGKDLSPASVELNVIAPREYLNRRMFTDLHPEYHGEDEHYIRRIELKPLTETRLTPEMPEAFFSYSLIPANAMEQEISFAVTNAQGVRIPGAAIQKTGKQIRVCVNGDGQFYLRATAKNGADHVRVISYYEIAAEGFGPVGLDPYGFVPGMLSDIRRGEITAGNDKGIAFARDGESMAGFSAVDFGPVGSDEITLPIFALDDKAYQLTLWDGVPDEGGHILAELPYQKPSIWNVYQPETYHLPEVLTGIHTLCFSMDRKIHLKGFSFARQLKAWRFTEAGKANAIYGDSFHREGTAITGIGNNVSLVFENMEFPEDGTLTLALDGKARTEKHAVTIRVTNASGETQTSLCTFSGGEKGVQYFDIAVLRGECTVTFVFLPGSDFDFYGFRFLSEKGV